MSRVIQFGLSALLLILPAAAFAGERASTSDGDRCCAPARGRWVEPVYEEKRVQVWIDAVYRSVCEPVWTPAVYRTTYEKIWRPPVTQVSCERVWIADEWDSREVVHREGNTTYTTRERVLVRPGHFESRTTETVLQPAFCETVERQELVSPGCYREERRQEIVTPGRFEYRVERICIRPGYWEAEG